jgi:lipid II:glycine glycyltransferase (peptidoglycan interpeptide bridge formation enzyme)
LVTVDVNDDNIDDFKAIMEHTAVRQNHFDRSKEYYLSLKKNLGDRVKMIIIYLDRDKYLADNSGDKLYDKIKEEDRKMIPLSAGVFIFDNDRANYVYGGTYSYYMPLMAQYKLQMDMIYFAMEKKIKLYDFGGISGNFKEGSPDYGVYEFKRGFGGYVVEYIGEFDLVVDRLFYNLYNVSYGVYRNLKKVMAKFKKK